MERVQRWREPAVVVVVLVLLVRLGLELAAAGGAFDVSAAGAGDPARLAARQLGEPTLFVVLALLVLACHTRPVTTHARTLAAVGLGVSGAGLLVALGLAVADQTRSTPGGAPDLADRLTGAVVAGMAVLLLGLLASAPSLEGAGSPAQEAGTGAEPATSPAVEVGEPAPDPALEPTWAPDVAAGAAWTTAGEAATGRPATAWGTPAGTGWEVTRGPGTGPGSTPADQAAKPSEKEEGHPWGRPSP